MYDAGTGDLRGQERDQGLGGLAQAPGHKRLAQRGILLLIVIQRDDRKGIPALQDHGALVLRKGLELFEQLLIRRGLNEPVHNVARHGVGGLVKLHAQRQELVFGRIQRL